MAPRDAVVYIHTDPIPHADILRRLARIERLLVQVGRAVNIEGEIMSELDDKLTTIETDLDALSADEARELADLQALKAAGQTLTADQEARLDAIAAKIAADDAAINAADPATPPAA